MNVDSVQGSAPEYPVQAPAAASEATPAQEVAKPEPAAETGEAPPDSYDDAGAIARRQELLGKAGTAGTGAGDEPAGKPDAGGPASLDALPSRGRSAKRPTATPPASRGDGDGGGSSPASDALDVKQSAPAEKTASAPELKDGTAAREDDKNMYVKLSDGRELTIPKDDGSGNPTTSIAEKDPKTGKLKMRIPAGKLSTVTDEGLREFLTNADTEIGKRQAVLDKLKADGAPKHKRMLAQVDLDRAYDTRSLGVRWLLDGAATHHGKPSVFGKSHPKGLSYNDMEEYLKWQTYETREQVRNSRELWKRLGQSPLPFKTNPNIKKPE
ncbi:MAG: hypothetical protein HYV63_08655 [Candidatus Schekmanbacteria bacterium]|nr:hypothetical protein [Candidatus Schekmanbacteria bacterium]